MKVLFLQKDLFERIGFMYLSAVLKQNGFKCDILVENLEKDFFEQIKKAKPDIVAFSCTTGFHSLILKTAKAVRKLTNAVVVLGGPHPTFFPDIIKDKSIDIILRGESDYAFLDLVNNMSKYKDITKIKNIWVKRNGKLYKNKLRPLIKDLDDLPQPDRSLYNKYNFFKKQQLQVVVSGRGCPYSCSFCFNKPFRDLYKVTSCVRKRSVKDVIKELQGIKKQGFAKRIIFEDDSFNADKKWLLKFCREYKKHISLPFSCALRADRIDEEQIRALNSAGCFTIKFGIETGDENLRNSVLKKALTNKQIITAARLVKKYKIKLKTYNLLCFPKETLSSAFETIDMNILIQADFAHSHVFQTFPGTELTRRSIEMGLLKEDFDFDQMDYSIFTKNYLKMKNKKELYNLQKFFSLCVDMPAFIPVVKKLIKLKPNKLFDLIFKLIYYYKSIKYEKTGFVDSLKLGWYGRNYFSKE